ncbi:MAG TPA: M13 family metallopeptidase [Polyangiaceae bacterium]|nr:M13 family metallopeptidase [Polyangiaceae bacterium]
MPVVSSRKFRICGAALACSVACASQPTAPNAPSSSPQAAEGAASSAGKPQFGSWGFDTAGMDRSVAPGSSFYRYANGHWLETTPIPPDKSNYGLFTALSDLSDERTREIIEGSQGAPGSEERKIADLYHSFLDEAGIEAKGLAPVQGRLDAIAKIRDTAGVVHEFARLARELSSNPLATQVGQDDRDPEHHIPNLGQGGLGLPDRDMYDPQNKAFEGLRAGYQEYATTLFTLAQLPHARERAGAVYALEEKLAKTHWTRVQNRDALKTYNKLSIAEVQKLAPGVPWALWLEDVGLKGQTHLNVNQPSAITGVGQLLQSEPLAVWKDYVALRTLSASAPYLPKAFVDAWFTTYGKTLSGTPELEARWRRGVDLVVSRLGEAVGKLYVAKYFTAQTKAAADELVHNLLIAMGQRLDGLTWMTPETKAKARAKLASYNPKIGYPKKWRDYSSLRIEAGDALGNAQRGAAFEYDRLLAKLGKPVDRDEWGMPTMMVNAYYNPTLNEIVFPAAILQPPFFDPNADPAVNYGGIGAVIGHEISHGFDDQGAQYDADGALRNWWTEEDAQKFKAATSRLVEQYASYCPFPAQGDKPAQCVNGQLTLGENIADLAGLTVAYAAYQLALAGKPAPVLDGFSGDQRFFLGWAQIWRRLYRDRELSNRLVTDPHSPSEFRSAVVRNLDPWYTAFTPAPADTLFLAPEQRVKIW